MGARDQDLKDTLPAGGRDRQETPQLIVIANGQAAAHVLPAKGELLLGRSSFADIYIDDPSISRRHALLRVEGERATIEDLGSATARAWEV